MSIEDPVLVVGGSGILAPLVATLTQAGRAVITVGRDDHAHRSPLARPLRADTTTHAGARSVGEAGPYDVAAIYRPAVTDQTLAILLDAVSARAVVVFTSSVADPGNSGEITSLPERLRPRAADGVLLLGWRANPPAWHSPQEVSGAAAAVLLSDKDRVLGVLRPWSARPG